jgi:hypothetical protein
VRAGKVQASDLPEMIASVWTRDDSPTTGLSEADWVELYRGSSPERKRRMSWAFEPFLAEELGARHSHFDTAAVYKATVTPDAILAYLERRDEGWTVVVDPAGLTDIEKLKDIHGPRH